jgi:hypothetical protein
MVNIRIDLFLTGAKMGQVPFVHPGVTGSYFLRRAWEKTEEKVAMSSGLRA